MSARKHLLIFYATAVCITLLVMVISFASFTRDPSAMGFWMRLMKYAETQGTYFNLVLYVRYALQEPFAWLIVMYASSPSVAALLTTSFTRGRVGVFRLLGRLHPWPDRQRRAHALRAYALLLAVHLAVCAFFIWRMYSAGGSTLAHALGLMGGTPLAVSLVILFGAFLDEGGLLEELGWRGFAQPLLQGLISRPLVVALVLGTFWWAWHLPRDIPTWLGGGADVAYAKSQAIFWLGCVAMSVTILYFSNVTGGSVLPAMLIHGWINLWSKAFIQPGGALFDWDLRTVLTVAGALAVLLLVGPRLGERGQPTG
jgi:uncharacterized protein